MCKAITKSEKSSISAVGTTNEKYSTYTVYSSVKPNWSVLDMEKRNNIVHEKWVCSCNVFMFQANCYAHSEMLLIS
jgi:hypothetical protein